MNQQWQKSFLGKLKQAQETCEKRFDVAMDECVTPAFEGLAEFLRDHGFKSSSPLSEEGRRSFKFELSENTYVLLMFHSIILCSTAP